MSEGHDGGYLDLGRVTDEDTEKRIATTAVPSGYLVLDKDGYLVPYNTHLSSEHSILNAVAKVTDCAGYELVKRELGAALVLAEAIRVIGKDRAMKKLSAASREAIETALAAIE